MTQNDRRILRLGGADVRDFLQGLVTNDVGRLSDGLVYAALLTPQGKYLADFFLVPDGDAVLLDADAAQGDMLVQRLSMYKLRADVTISEAEVHLHRGTGDVPADAYADPRHSVLGWRAYRDAPQPSDDTDWAALNVAAMVPQTGQELHNDTFILEMGFERLNGVDFRKGCYVGQEVTARMKHKTELRKGLARVHVSGLAHSGDTIMREGKEVGRLHTLAGDKAMAYLRFDRVGEGMTAGDAGIELLERS